MSVSVSVSEGLKDFQKHHKNKWNLRFHVLCGIIYTSLLLSAFYGSWSIPIYILLLIGIFPRYLIENIGIGAILFIMHFIWISLGLSTLTKCLFAVLFYMAPELSHIGTGEATVLSVTKYINNPVLILENIVLLLPYSVYSSAPTRKTITEP